MLSPVVPYSMVLACWVVYFHWSDINQTYLSLYLLVFAIPLVKLNVNLVVSIGHVIMATEPSLVAHYICIQVACCTESGLTFDSAVIAPFIAVGNALLGFLIPEVLLLLLLMVISVSWLYGTLHVKCVFVLCTVGVTVDRFIRNFNVILQLRHSLSC